MTGLVATERDYFQRELHDLETRIDKCAALLKKALQGRRPHKKTVRAALRELTAKKAFSELLDDIFEEYEDVFKDLAK